MAILILLAQCVAMFLASFLAGSLPLMFKSALSGKRLKIISVLGMGLLVGAALTIIIPEGVSTLYGALPGDGDAIREEAVEAIGWSLLAGFALMLLIESLTPHPPHSPPPSPQSSPPSFHEALQPDGVGSPESRPAAQHYDSHSPIIPKRLHVRDAEGGKEGKKSRTSAVHGLNATLGLVIHGAADGIALGASSLSGKGSLSLIIFLAVLVHKGPTALGLTTTLLSLSLDHPAIRKRLVIFSFAAPLGAIITYLLVRAFGGNNVGTGHPDNGVDGLMWWTGIALLFSGGSFLYVATVIQPLSAPTPHSHTHAHHTDVEDGGDEEQELGKYARTVVLVVGMVLPALLGLLVGDDH